MNAISSGFRDRKDESHCASPCIWDRSLSAALKNHVGCVSETGIAWVNRVAVEMALTIGTRSSAAIFGSSRVQRLLTDPTMATTPVCASFIAQDTVSLGSLWSSQAST